MAKDVDTPPTVEHITDMPTYVPPGHSGTTNVRLVDRAFAGTFEMVLGRVEPGGVADNHHHAAEAQAIYVTGGRARVRLGDGSDGEYGPGTVFRIPPGMDHEVTSLGPDVLEVVIVYSPPLNRT